jgi:hypothetical protein
MGSVRNSTSSALPPWPGHRLVQTRQNLTNWRMKAQNGDLGGSKYSHSIRLIATT